MSRQRRFAFSAMPDAVEYSIQVLRESFASPERNPSGLPFWGGFSGGKDSVVIKQLMVEAGVPCDWHYGVTTIDPPEVVRFIHQTHPDVVMLRSAKYRNFGDLLAKRGLPTRIRRFCCTVFKELRSPNSRTKVLGIRAEESAKRKALWPEFKPSWMKNDGPLLCPILFWTQADVWEFIEDRKLPYCTLYDEGFDRLGCVACPMATPAYRQAGLKRYPHVDRMLRDGVRRLWERRGPDWRYREIFATPDAMFEWWMSDSALPHEEAMPVLGSFAEEARDGEA